MAQRSVAPSEQVQDIRPTEYNVMLDGVIAVPNTVDQQVFFDGLVDAILEYVERNGARAALSLDRSAFIEANEDNETDDGEQISQDR